MNESDPNRLKTGGTVEWPTLMLIALAFAGFAGLTLFYSQLPWWLIMPSAGYLLALYGSLQHEILHGHPTRWQWFNELLVFPSLVLWIPYLIYKQSHLVHHNNDRLTDPAFDPESYYQPRQQWESYPAWIRAYFVFCNTFFGRLVWGPVHLVASTIIGELKSAFDGDFKNIQAWILHGFSVSIVLIWITGACDIPIVEYIVLFTYPGLSLTLLRSYLEHQVAEQAGHRSVIVESNPLLSLMFLNNNLHAIHHEQPGLPWYRIPAIWRVERERVLEANNHYYYPGYASIALRYFGKAKENPCYPR